MFKIIWRTFFGGMMIACLVIVLFFSCAGIVNYKKAELKPVELENAIENVYNNNNFIIFEKHVLTDKIGNLCHLTDNCTRSNKSIYINLASSSGGALRSINRRIYSLTAAHFCVEFPDHIGEAFEETEPWDEIIVAKFMGIVHKGRIEKFDVEKDICLISFEHENNIGWATDRIKLAKDMPKIGERVFAVSSPLGINGTNFRLHFDGKYAGCDDILGCLYTMPATYGSSGNLVLNSRGELISVLSVSVLPFQEIAGGSSVHQIREFLKEFKQDTGIKLY